MALRLRTESAAAAAFYEQVGFRWVDLPHCTHDKELEMASIPDAPRAAVQ
jgi:hypothetical protein